jgi:hypothetical protein
MRARPIPLNAETRRRGDLGALGGIWRCPYSDGSSSILASMASWRLEAALVRAAVFDCFSGIAGDMTLAALCDAGASLDHVRAGLLGLDIPPFSLALEPVTRGGLRATYLRVHVPEERTYQPAELRARVTAAPLLSASASVPSRPSGARRRRGSRDGRRPHTSTKLAAWTRSSTSSARCLRSRTSASKPPVPRGHGR